MVLYNELFVLEIKNIDKHIELFVSFLARTKPIILKIRLKIHDLVKRVSQLGWLRTLPYFFQLIFIVKGSELLIKFKEERMNIMPLFLMKEIWTPLKLVGVKFFKSDDRSIFIKVMNQRRRKLK